jgi:cysteine desulfurase
MKVYADNAATTKINAKAFDEMVFHMNHTYGNPSSLYTLGQIAKDVLEEAREGIAGRLGALSSEVYFTAGGSESDNQAIHIAATLGERSGKKHIISSAIEHHAVLHTLEKLKKRGFEITYLPVYENGIVKIDDLKDAIRKDTCLVSIMYVNNEVGTIQPVDEIGDVCRKEGILFHTDAVQAVGHIPVDMHKSNIDMLSLSAHKFHGPKGVGALLVRKGILMDSFIEGGAQERGRRAGTESVPAIRAMKVALDEALDDLEKKQTYLAKMRDHLQEKLELIPHSKINGDIEKRVPGTLNICFEGIEGEALLLFLNDKGVSVSSGSACTSGSLDPSHVLLAMGLPHEIAHGSLRASLSGENTMEEMDHVIEAVNEVVDYLRKMSPVWRDLQEGKKEYVIH